MICCCSDLAPSARHLLTHESNNEQLPQEQEEIRHLVQHGHPARKKEAGQRRTKLGKRTHAWYRGSAASTRQQLLHTHLITFLMSRKKASLAAVQKFLPYIAT